MARIVITEPMDERAVARLRAAHDVFHDPHLVDDAPRLLQLAGGADALIVRNRTQVRGALLQALARCRVVGRLGVGMDNIDMDGCAARGMQVFPATGANALSVAEYVVTAALLLLRGAYQASAAVSGGQWPRAALSNGREVAGKTLGLVGFGSIGQTTARLARGLGMEVSAFDAMMDEDHPAFAQGGVRCAGLEEVLTTADVVSLHVPLLGSTRGLLDAARIAAMKPGAVLVNTARGGIVDELAVAAALKSGHLGGAALDVFEAEPQPAAPHFEGCPNLLLTPHVAGVTQESNDRVSGLIADRVLQALR
ncbi:(S)-sulfolactate dehydrogenase [Rubrivivax sp. A210]|uniref:hydroxyacid dehydrogenase n=1 Tax=Rubrivivax sp. A210 TaxID=2772301 RepID=UPI001919C1B4|nr:hydroxyacid dehydrogenase [Rubrivivax sp. A210]CAD5372219.1 (S)-sulfolactate dehydrogenase [Rubrivivax sp. A210]